MKESLPERTELGQRRDGAGEDDAVANERRFVDVNACRLEHRLQLLSDGVIRPSDERRFAIVRLEKTRRFLRSPPLEPPRNDPPWMATGERQRIYRIGARR